ncbi:MAG: FAD-dependent oxidoreductase [Herpetosiphon sp.]
MATETMAQQQATSTRKHAALDVVKTTCCIVGGGPAGAVLALLLARQGIDVMLLEAHADFDREFRGDTLHPSILEVLDEIGLADRLLRLPHTKIQTLTVVTEAGPRTVASLSRLKTRFPFITMMPQSRFLSFVTEEAGGYPNFRLVMHAHVQELVEEAGSIRGVRYQGRDGWHEIRALLTVGTDGRFSRLRHLAGFVAIPSSPPMDVLWLRLPRLASDPAGAMGHFGKGALLVQLDRGNEWQLGYVIRKGSFKDLKVAGIDAFHRSLTAMAPELADRVTMLHDWNQMSLLSVAADRLPRWYKPGLLLLGDAAHVMSPVGGNGINYAVMDAVAAANLLTGPLRAGSVGIGDLAAVQRRRAWPVRIIQAMVNVMQDRIITRALDPATGIRLPWVLRLPFVQQLPFVRDLPARIMGFGIRREHVAPALRKARALQHVKESV